MTDQLEVTMTEIYIRNSWGCQTTRSGPTATLERTLELRTYLPECFTALGVESILDVGCGDFGWMQSVKLDGIQYLGVDIVKTLVESLQNQYTKDNIQFQKMNVCTEPPETADLWLARDLLQVLDFSSISLFFEKFLESGSLYLGLTSNETETENKDSLPGIQRPLDLFMSPFQIPNPKKIIYDGEQWFRRRLLVVWTRDDIHAWWNRARHQFKPSSQPNLPSNTTHDTQDRNAHLKSNISLKNYPVHGHTE